MFPPLVSPHTDPPAQHQGPRLLCTRHSAPFSRGQSPEVLPLLRPAMMLRPWPRPFPLAPPLPCPAQCSAPHCTSSLAACDRHPFPPPPLHLLLLLSNHHATAHAAVGPPTWEPQRRKKYDLWLGINDFEHRCLRCSTAQADVQTHSRRSYFLIGSGRTGSAGQAIAPPVCGI